jgi:hypothetical protein
VLRVTIENNSLNPSSKKSCISPSQDDLKLAFERKVLFSVIPIEKKKIVSNHFLNPYERKREKRPFAKIA